jgi:hypothetical protein
MPYQSTPTIQSSTNHVQSNDVDGDNTIHLLTQPTSNLSTSSFNNSVSITNSTTTHNSFSSSNHTISDGNSVTLSPPSSQFNNRFGCRSVLNEKRSTCKNDQEYFKVLYVMYSGCDGPAKSRIQALIDNKHSTVTIRTVKPIKKVYVEELLRRYAYLQLKERGIVVGKQKNFRPTNKSQEEISSLFHSPQFRLPTSEKLYVEYEMEEFLSTHEHELKVTLEELQHQGSEILKSDLKRMRLWEAIFLDSKYMRDKLVHLKRNMSREEIDARNSKVGPLTLFHLAAEKYNDPNWVVHSRIMPDLNEKFRNPIRLALMTDDEPMTEMSVKQAYTDAKGKLNVALAHWKRSGNGKGNISNRVRGLTYDDNNKNDGNTVTYIDDDRFNFVKHLHIAYFWSLCEISGLTHHISQNCSALNNFGNNGDTTASSSTSGKVRGRYVKQGAGLKKQKVDQQTEALFAMVSDIKKGFVQQNNELKKSTLTSQLLDAEDALSNL